MLPSALTAWPFEMGPAYSCGVELGAIRISPVVAANGSFRCCHQRLRRGDAARSHGADLSERFWSDCRSHEQRVQCQLEHTQAVPVVREKQNDDTWRAHPAFDFGSIYSADQSANGCPAAGRRFRAGSSDSPWKPEFVARIWSSLRLRGNKVPLRQSPLVGNGLIRGRYRDAAVALPVRVCRKEALRVAAPRSEFARLFAGGKWIRTIGTRKISYRFERTFVASGAVPVSERDSFLWRRGTDP